VVNPSLLVSPTLRAALRTYGFSKLSALVLGAQGEYAPTDGSYEELAKCLGAKFASNHMNRAVILDGLTALEELNV